jgi:Predicted membrane protein
LSKEIENVIVLYIDRDGDIEKVTNLKTPIVGREENLKAAQLFGLQFPDDADLNALYYSIKLYDEIKTNGGFKSCEIVTISGDVSEGVSADLKIRNELMEICNKLKPDGVIFVSDGGRDELIIPLISSIIPILSVKRVVVGQSKGIEETYILIYKYLKRLVQDPYLSKIFVGVPGLLLILYGLLVIFNLASIFSIVLVIVIGLVLIVKGFSIDEVVKKEWTASRIQFIGGILAFILGLIVIYNGIGGVYEFIKSNPDYSILQAIGVFIVTPFAYGFNTLHAFSIAIIIFLVARMVDNYLENKSIKHELIYSVFIFSLSIIGTYIGFVIIRPGLPSNLWGFDFLTMILILFVLNAVLIVTLSLYERLNRSPKNPGES